MMKEKTIVSVYPSTYGFAYVVLERCKIPVAWGQRDIRGNKNERSVKEVAQVVEERRPDVLVIRKCAEYMADRCKRINELVRQLVELGKEEGIEVAVYSRTQIREVFRKIGVVTKHEIALAIIDLFPEFGKAKPRPRKAWEHEDYRMGVFNAMSLIYTYCASCDCESGLCSHLKTIEF